MANGLRLIDQLVAIRLKYPESSACIKQGVLRWSGYLKPTPLSRVYHVLVNYKMKERPVVTLIGDNIQGLDRQDFPHHFYKDCTQKRVDLCLHLAYEFNSGMLISDTIIPWAVEWLYFYEIWLATGTWCGGGKHPVVKGKRVLKDERADQASN